MRRWITLGFVLTLVACEQVCSPSAGCVNCTASLETRLLFLTGINQPTADRIADPQTVPRDNQDFETVETALRLEDRCGARMEFQQALPDRPPPSPFIGPRGFGDRLSVGGAVLSPLVSASERISGTDVERRLYVANSATNELQVWNPQTSELLGRVGVSRWPRGIAVSPDGTTVYVSSQIGRRIHVIDSQTLEDLAQVELPQGDEPFDLEITPDGSEIWVTNFVPRGGILVIDTATRTIVERVDRVGLHTLGLDFSPDGRLAIASSRGNNRVSLIDASTRRVLARLTVEDPYGVLFDDTGNRFFTTSETAHGQVRMFNTADQELLQTWDVGVEPQSLALDETGRFLYVSNRLSAFISVVDLYTNKVGEPIPVPLGIGLAVPLSGPGT